MSKKLKEKVKKLEAENRRLKKEAAADAKRSGANVPPYFDSEIFDAWEEQAEKRRKASRDPDWTPADIIVTR